MFVNTKKDSLLQKILEDFLERMHNAIAEKRTLCLKEGLSLDDANHVIIQAIKKIPENLLPEESANFVDELKMGGRLKLTFPVWPSEEVDDTD